MFQTDDEIFVQFPDEGAERILHPGKITETDRGILVAWFDQEDLSRHTEREILVFYQRKNRFLQRPARIDTVAVDPTGSELRFKLGGDSVSAESRGSYRVRVSATIHADLGSETGCRLVDVSLGGFAVVAKQPRQIGDVLEARLHHAKAITGQVRVQSIRQLGHGRMRYGLLCVDPRTSSELFAGLREISMILQRQQLRRLSGAD